MRSNKRLGEGLKRRRFTIRTTLKIVAPKALNFLEENARVRLFNFLETVANSLQNGKRVVIDFCETIDLQPCGTIIFMAHLDEWVESYPAQITCTYPEDDVVEQLFQHVGVLFRLGLSPRKKVEDDRVRYWHYHSGTNTDSATYKELTKSIRDGIIHPAKELFADCLNEAVVNTVNHAYRFGASKMLAKAQQKWWMFSLLKDDQLFVAIYDRGVGIPDSLRRKPEWTQYLRLRQYKDARLIEAAIDSKLTSTKLPHRGKGLPEMLEFSQNLKAGGFSIWSKKGGVSYNAELGVGHRRRLPLSLPGTLVLWSIPFRKEHEHADNNDIGP